MKILYVVTKSERGGAQQHVLDLATDCFLQRNEVIVALGERTGWLVTKLREQKIPIHFLKLNRSWNPFHVLFYLLDFLKEIRQVQPDLIHFHSSHTLMGTWVVRLFFPKIRTIVTIHGLSFLYPGIAMPLVRFVYLSYMRLALIFANEIIFVCQFDQGVFEKLGLLKKKKFSIIYNGLDEPPFFSRAEARSRLGIPDDKIVIGTLGRFSFPKQIDLLVRAVAQMDRKDALLCLIGEGPEEHVLKSLVHKLDMSHRTYFVRGDASYLKAFDIFVLSSRYEGLPYSVLEAALAELPIVATNVGGVSEMIEQNKSGFLIQSHSVLELAHACQFMLDQKEEARAMAQEARRFVRIKFSKNQMLQKIRDCYRLL